MKINGIPISAYRNVGFSHVNDLNVGRESQSNEYQGERSLSMLHLLQLFCKSFVSDLPEIFQWLDD